MNLTAFNPFPEMSTERLLLRQLRFADAHSLAELRSNKTVNEHLDRPATMQFEEANNFIEKVNRRINDRELLYWVIALKGTGNFAGAICLWNIEADKDRAELGYELHPDYQGQGIMQEALQQVIQFGFDTMQLDLILALTKPANKASEKLLVKNSFLLDEDYRYMSRENAKDYLVYYRTSGNRNYDL